MITLLPGAEYDFESGTSVAAAEITGVVALLLSANNRLTTDSIVSVLKSTRTGDPAAVDRCRRGAGEGGSRKSRRPARSSLTEVS